MIRSVFVCGRHNDLPWNIRKFVHNRLARLQLEDLRQGPGPWSRSKWSQTDLSRLRAGFVGGQVKTAPLTLWRLVINEDSLQDLGFHFVLFQLLATLPS